jgi:hypothetical protein
MGFACILPVPHGRIEADSAIQHLGQPPPGRAQLVIDILTAAATAFMSGEVELLADIKHPIFDLIG